jgi:hypothetical protein
MSKHDYIILVMVVAGIATNFLGAAFTIRQLRAHWGREVGHKGPFDTGLPAFSVEIVFVEIKAISAFVVRVVRLVRDHVGAARSKSE